MIKKYHRILKTGTSDSRKNWFAVGDYKKRPNVVGDTKTTSPEKVSIAMEKLISTYYKKKFPTLESIIEFHYVFEQIHPFQDGNGRVGRLIMFKECLANNITPFIIEDKYKMFYYRSLKNNQNKNAKRLPTGPCHINNDFVQTQCMGIGLKEYRNEKGYLLDTCRSAQDEYEKLINYFFPKSK